MLTRRQVIRRGALVAVALAGLPLGWPITRTATAGQEIGPPVADPDGLLDLPPGFGYTALIRSGETMADGNTFPPDPDMGAVVDLGDGTFYLVVGHEIRADLEYEGAFTGSVTRLHLGLDSAAERVRLAGGSFDIESDPGIGTTVRFTLPARATG